MNNDIKEILDNIKKCCEVMQDENFVVYQKQDIIKLLDYITNLQQELEKLKELKENASNVCMAEHRYAVDKAEEARDYKSRVEKAVEYIKINFVEDIITVKTLLNILNGRSDE